ncbi:ceramidase [Podospora fimiseda]|uniref:Ceramidase n=1 Tax=Podospora fimiseda TaxID=252190 RepID=A0AAN6YLX7_9PEZI|nr:ceramidase [Podospora fimiseda]
MGHHNLHYGGDQYSFTGKWSPPTSRANFCEEDYAITFYLAEFINSISNLAYIYLALKAMRHHSPDFMSLSLLALGIGSFLFHATLRAAPEFCDELSMLLLTWSMLHSVLTVPSVSRSKSLGISLSLTVIFVLFSTYYISSPQIIYHVIAFATALGIVTLRSQYLFHWVKFAGREKDRDWNKRTWEAIGVCLVGYALWNIDLSFCGELRRVREWLGFPWAWGLELHGWWHLLTAFGAARFMDVAREMKKLSEFDFEPRFDEKLE